MKSNSKLDNMLVCWYGVSSVSTVKSSQDWLTDNWGNERENSQVSGSGSVIVMVCMSKDGREEHS